MRAGDVIDDRFEIDELAGSGGMGHVYRARDRGTGEIVALKVLQNAGSQDSGRLAREAQALAALRLPGVVRYIAHGATAVGHPYLAMEWLTGETLSQRLARQTLTIEESVALGMRIAATLGSVHQLGIVHRDLKPSNLLLVGGAIDRVTLIDFGIVRISGIEQQLTMPGAILGTPGYMAPEQARGEAQLDARADVFALGCVLYKCLSGRAPFRGARGLAVLVKVLLEEPPQLRWLRDDVPVALDDLVTRMLSKAPEGRPRDGDAVVAELEALDAALEGLAGAAPHSRAPISSMRTPEITTGERKVMCLVLARDGLGGADPTCPEEEEHGRAQALHATAARYQGQLELIEARLPLAVLSGAGAPTDLAARAARCALAVQTLLGGAPVSVVTGRAEIASRLPIGDLIDRVVQLLPAGRPAGDGPAIRIDEVTASLLGARFEITSDAGGSWLHGAREELEVEATPHLLGKPTACVGRERELSLIRAEFSRCVEESAPSVVVVTGPAGMGKSRLRHEIVRALRNEGEPVEVWLGQVDPMSAGSSFGLLAHALRRAIGLFEGDALEARRRKVRARVERHAGLDVARVSAFLGELCGAPFPDDDDVQLRAARRSPMLMGDQLRLAWEDFLRAECAAGPVLLVLEDLHWGDLPTVTMVDAALRNLKDRPLMVLALGRPEVHELFPKLWDERRGHKLRLAGLPRRASERLVRQVLGAGAEPGLVATLVERADGNAFYLEEQIRAAASGKGSDLPETVLAMVQSELDALDVEARRVLRAASVFGETFWRSGVAALVGGGEVERRLDELERIELIVRRAADEPSSVEAEYRFRHALVREAAYGMLTDHDRRLGHRLAGDWLERAGGAAPMALAEHFERGGEPVRAATSYLRAAEQALRGNDLGAAIERAERGIACGAAAPTVGALRLIEAEAHLWRGEFALAEQRGIDAMERLTPGSAPWFSAITQKMIAASKLGSYDEVERWLRAARDADAMEEARCARSICLCAGAGRLIFGGRYGFADALFGVIERDVMALAEVEVAARLYQARSFRAMASGDPGACLVGFEAALAAFEEAGDRRNACWARNNVGYYYAELGDFEGAEAALRAALAEAERMGLHDAVLGVLHNLGPVLAQRGFIDEAERTERAAVATYHQLGDARMGGAARSYLARILMLSGDFEGAEGEARAAVELLKSTPPLRAFGFAGLSRVLLETGRQVDALAVATEAFLLLSSVGAETGESLVRLVHAEALHANGFAREAAMAITAARGSVLAKAAKISDPVWRERFLRKVPDNVATLALAERWLGEGAC